MKRIITILLCIAVGLAVLGVPAAVGAKVTGKLEIVHWWTAGGEGEALDAIAALFEANYPEIELIGASVAGGAGTVAKGVLQTRILAGNPPDSFQVHAGMEVRAHILAGTLEPITDLLDPAVFPKAVLDLCGYEGEVYCVPINVHRPNTLWVNKEVVDELGIAIPTLSDFNVFVAACEKAKAAGYVPLALGEAWTVNHLFGSVLLGALGPDGYRGLWDGSVPFTDPGVTLALERMKTLVGYANEDHAALSWDAAAQMLVDGKAVFNIMGDWAEGYFKAKGWEPGVDFVWASAPGTRGSFILCIDAFGVPKDAVNKEGARAWVKTIASIEAQDIFNPVKGSVPARSGADKSLYDVYLIWSMNDFATSELVPSLAHGGVLEALAGDIGDIINIFVTKPDVAGAQRSLNQAAIDAGL